MKRKSIISKLKLYIPLLIIMIISLFTMYNSRYMNRLYNAHLIKQILWYLIFFITILFMPKLKNVFKYSSAIYIINLLFLFLVLLFGNKVNGARAWFNFKFISFQPSELMKFSYTLYLANIMSKYKYTNTKRELLFITKIIIIFLIPSILIFLEPDTGAIIFLLIITIGMLFLSNIRKRWIFIIIILSLSLLSVFFYLFYFNQDILIKLIGTSFFYRMDRIINFSNNMQLENSLIAIGSAGYFGTGFKSVAIYIPESPTDFAFSLCVSSFGFITAVILLMCYFVLDCYFISLLYRQKNKSIKLFTCGFVCVFIFSQLYNICMNIGFLPIMGIALPLLSYGGSSLIVFGFYIAIILKSNNI